MTKWVTMRQKLMGGRSDADIDFEEPRAFLKHFGFAENIEGSHYAFDCPDIREILVQSYEN